MGNNHCRPVCIIQDERLQRNGDADCKLSSRTHSAGWLATARSVSDVRVSTLMILRPQLLRPRPGSLPSGNRAGITDGSINDRKQEISHNANNITKRYVFVRRVQPLPKCPPLCLLVDDERFQESIHNGRQISAAMAECPADRFPKIVPLRNQSDWRATKCHKNLSCGCSTSPFSP